MCGGLTRWLRIFGVDATYESAIEDRELVAKALAEDRVVISADHKLFERREFTQGRVRGVLLPVGLKLTDQVAWAFRALALEVGFPRCSECNGELAVASRDEVGDRVPARSLIWAREFYRCLSCGHVFWQGTHWRRIEAVKKAISRGTDRQETGTSLP